MMCGLENLGLVDQNRLERDLSAFLLRTLAVGRQQQSELIEIALEIWNKESVLSTYAVTTSCQ